MKSLLRLRTPVTFAFSAKLGAALLLASAALVAPGCGKTVSGGGSGETHFLASCDATCAEGLSCVCGVCTKPCTEDTSCAGLAAHATCEAAGCNGGGSSCDATCHADADCKSLGAAFTCTDGRCREPAGTVDGGSGGSGGSDTADAGGNLECAPGCTRILAQQVTACAESHWEAVECECSPNGGLAMPTCHQRVSDGTAWLFPATGLAHPEHWTSCNDTENAASALGCDFNGSYTGSSNCVHPPPSVCTKVDTCKELDCGGLEFDTKGCARISCTADADCAADERCNHLTCTNTSVCSEQAGPGTCGCAGVTACISGDKCAPVTLAGPRGTWDTLEVNKVNGLCPQGQSCTDWWHVSADGGLAAEKSGEPISSAISAEDLDTLRNLVNGPDLRVALRDGIPCDPPPTDVGVQIVLKLSTETLQRDVTGCVFSGPAGNVFQQLDQLVTKY